MHCVVTAGNEEKHIKNLKNFLKSENTASHKTFVYVKKNLPNAQVFRKSPQVLVKNLQVFRKIRARCVLKLLQTHSIRHGFNEKIQKSDEFLRFFNDFFKN
jgi:hypothetical protein